MATANDTAPLFAAAEQLSRTQRGRFVMRQLLSMLDEGGLGLDAPSQRAAIALLRGAWGSFPGTARDAMREALGP